MSQSVMLLYSCAEKEHADKRRKTIDIHDIHEPISELLLLSLFKHRLGKGEDQ